MERETKDTISTAHDFDSQIDSILKIMRQNSYEACRHHPVQTGQSYTTVITVSLKHLEETVRKVK